MPDAQEQSVDSNQQDAGGGAGAPAVAATADAQADTVEMKVPAAAPTRVGAKGRKRPADEIERAKASAALTRKVSEDPTVIKDVALSALKQSGGVGPAMVAAFKAGIQQQFGVTFGTPALRSMLDRLKREGILASRKFGTRYDWFEGTGKPQGKPGRKPKAETAAAKPARAAKKAGRPARAGRKPAALKRPVGRPAAFKGGDAAAQLVEGLKMALAAANALQGEMRAVSKMRDQLLDVMRRI